MVDVQRMAVAQDALTLRSKGKGQGHAVTKRVAGVGLHVDRTAEVFIVT